MTKLILEAVDIVFGREALRRPAVVAQQIADRVVVLAVSEAADELGWACAYCVRKALAGGCGFLFRQRCKILDPFSGVPFVFRAGVYTLTASVADAIGRLVQERRSGRAGAIN